MSADVQNYVRAEEALLASEGVTAEARLVELERLGGKARVLIAGEGPPVLFVPGVMTGGAVFAGLVGRLPDFRCIMIDRPGTGLSPLLPSPPTDLPGQERVADALLVDVMDSLGLDRTDIVSTSLGGWTTFRSAAAHPDRFTRISALAFQMGARIENAPMSMRMPAPAWMLPRRIKATPRLVRAMLKSAGMRGAIERGLFSDELLGWIVAQLRYTETFRNDSIYNPGPIGPRGPIDEVRHSRELLACVTAPVHLFWGADDIFAGEDSAREFAEMLPDAKVEMIDGAGHAPWLDEPELAASAVRQHFSV